MEWCVRFAGGGLVGFPVRYHRGCLKPKGFAGLFGASPSVALASLSSYMQFRQVPSEALPGKSTILPVFTCQGDKLHVKCPAEFRGASEHQEGRCGSEAQANAQALAQEDAHGARQAGGESRAT
jgi:hypothetical protein